MVLAAAPAARTAGPVHVGADGRVAVTPVGYRLTPAGKQTFLGELPLGMVLSPDGASLVVSNNGVGTQSLQVVNPATGAVRQQLNYARPASLFRGLAFTPEGSTLFASGGGDEQVHQYRVLGGQLFETTPIRLPRTNASGAPINLYPAGLAATADRRRLVVADLLGDAISVVSLGDGKVATVPAGHRPVAVAVTPDGGTAWVSDQGADTVTAIDLTKPQPVAVAVVRVGTHPAGLVLNGATGRLYVAAADSDQIAVVDTVGRTLIETISVAPYRDAQVGSTPVALALSADRRTLYVAEAGNNDVDVLDLATERRIGAIPTGWYPSALVATAGQLFVANAKGVGTSPVHRGYLTFPGPSSADHTDYSGPAILGTLTTVSLPLQPLELQRWTEQANADAGLRASGRRRNHLPPIRHVIYVVQENRTYDQEFGSLGKGDGDASLDLFGEESAPNMRALSRDFVTFDNFYADAEVSAQGWNWAVAANSNPYIEELWPGFYSGRDAPYPAESPDPAEAPNRDPANAYIWDRLAAAHVSFRNYGFYVQPSPHGGFTATDPVLNANTDHAYRGFDLACPDNADTFAARRACGVPRISEWQREFALQVAAGTMPAVELVRLPNDHTSGTKPGMPTPRAYVADNDLALGRLVETVSHSQYWRDTAIFVTEDDAQNGPDHIDAHRTLSQIISPWTRSGSVDSTFYSTSSILATIEQLVGIAPLTQFDTFATAMSAAFLARPDTTPYTAVRPVQAGNATNSARAPMAAVSARQSLRIADQIDPIAFNQAIWQSIRGRHSRMPAPRHGLAAMPTTRVADPDG